MKQNKFLNFLLKVREKYLSDILLTFSIYN